MYSFRAMSSLFQLILVLLSLSVKTCNGRMLSKMGIEDSNLSSHDLSKDIANKTSLMSKALKKREATSKSGVVPNLANDVKVVMELNSQESEQESGVSSRLHGT